MKITNEKAHELREQFPLLRKKIDGKDIVYLDSAATSQKPWSVINAISDYYSNHNANIHRGMYSLSEEATELYHTAKKTVAQFLNAHHEEIVFTKGTTEAINLIAHSCETYLKGKKNIVIAESEHHSNLLPWQHLAKVHNLELRFIPIQEDFTLNYSQAQEQIDSDTAIVACAHVSNALGTINDITLICTLAREKGALSVVDAAQSIGHLPVDVKEIDCDLLAFSSHKMLGPMGCGVLYGKRDVLEKLNPYHLGGDMIDSVTHSDAVWAQVPMKFEAGTQNVAGAIGTAAAIQFIEKIGRDVIHDWDKTLVSYAYEKMQAIESVTIHSAHPENCSGVLSFTMDCAQPGDIAQLLSGDGICVRAGHHCAMPLMNTLQIPGTCRASFYLYNTKEDVDALVQGIKRIEKTLR